MGQAQAVIDPLRGLGTGCDGRCCCHRAAFVKSWRDLSTNF